MFHRILLATDGSDSALRAAQAAGELAGKFNAEVLVIYVLLPVPVMEKIALETGDQFSGAGSVASIQGLSQAGERILARTARVLDQAGARYSARLERGHPAKRVCEVAQEESCDAIFIGRQGVGRAAALSWGSVAEEISRCASCSVVIVK